MASDAPKPILVDGTYYVPGKNEGSDAVAWLDESDLGNLRS